MLRVLFLVSIVTKRYFLISKQQEYTTDKAQCKNLDISLGGIHFTPTILFHEIR
jgi:hypothetical protein